MIDQATTDPAISHDRRVPPAGEPNAATVVVQGDEPEIAPELDQRQGPLARYDERHKVLWIGSMPVPFRIGENRNAELLDLLSMAIRQLRGLEPSDPCLLRRSEHKLLAGLLDLDDAELRFDLRRYLGLSRRQAGDTVAQLRRVLSDDAARLA